MADCKLDQRTQKWLREGRGSGSGQGYHPWLTVRDLSSRGRSHRVWGHLTQRTHHLLSDIELATFLLLEWNPSVTDIREQYPLHLDDTLVLAEQAGIRHPAVSGFTHIMSTDFLVDLSTDSGPQQLAIQVKSSSDLKDIRTVEKLEIERLYWKLKGIPWKLLTEKQIPKTVVKNLDLLYPSRKQTEKLEILFTSLPTYVEFLAAHPHTKVAEIAMLIDSSYSLEAGTSLSRIRALAALRALTFQISTPWNNLTGGEIHIAHEINQLRSSYAANQ